MTGKLHMPRTKYGKDGPQTDTVVDRVTGLSLCALGSPLFQQLVSGETKIRCRHLGFRDERDLAYVEAVECPRELLVTGGSMAVGEQAGDNPVGHGARRDAIRGLDGKIPALKLYPQMPRFLAFSAPISSCVSAHCALSC
jgi:hypothetical protein